MAATHYYLFILFIFAPPFHAIDRLQVMIADAIRQHDEPFHRRSLDRGKIMTLGHDDCGRAEFRPAAIEIDQVTGMPDEALIRTVFCLPGSIGGRCHAATLVRGAGPDT